MLKQTYNLLSLVHAQIKDDALITLRKSCDGVVISVSIEDYRANIEFSKACFNNMLLQFEVMRIKQFCDYVNNRRVWND